MYNVPLLTRSKLEINLRYSFLSLQNCMCPENDSYYVELDNQLLQEITDCMLMGYELRVTHYDFILRGKILNDFKNSLVSYLTR